MMRLVLLLYSMYLIDEAASICPSICRSHLIYIKDAKPLGTRERKPMLKTIQCSYSTDILLNVNVNCELSSLREIWMFMCLSLYVTYHFRMDR